MSGPSPRPGAILRPLGLALALAIPGGLLGGAQGALLAFGGALGGLFGGALLRSPPPRPIAPPPLRPAPAPNLARALQVAEDRERRRIARILHDGLQPTIAAARLLLASPDGLAPVDAALAEALRLTRILAHGLAPAQAPAGLIAALQLQIDQAQAWHGVKVDRQLPAEVPCDPLTAEVAAAILGELLFNASRHAPGATVTVRLDVAQAWLLLRVDDDGPGYDPATTPGGGGTRAIEERAEAIGGHVDTWSAPGAGVHITLGLPTEVAPPAPGAAAVG